MARSVFFLLAMLQTLVGCTWGVVTENGENIPGGIVVFENCDGESWEVAVHNGGYGFNPWSPSSPDIDTDKIIPTGYYRVSVRRDGVERQVRVVDHVYPDICRIQVNNKDKDVPCSRVDLDLSAEPAPEVADFESECVRRDILTDSDGDGVMAGDNCANVANADQLDFDGNGVGTACDPSEIVFHLDRPVLKATMEIFVSWRVETLLPATEFLIFKSASGAEDSWVEAGRHPFFEDLREWRDAEVPTGTVYYQVKLAYVDENGGDSLVSSPIASINTDPDNDGLKTYQDNCPGTANPPSPEGVQADEDGDGIGDPCDSTVNLESVFEKDFGQGVSALGAKVANGFLYLNTSQGLLIYDFDALIDGTTSEPIGQYCDDVMRKTDDPPNASCSGVLHDPTSFPYPYNAGGSVTAIHGNYAFITRGNQFDQVGGLTIVDTSNKRAPILAGHLVLSHGASDIELRGGLAYVGGYDAGVYVIDISDYVDNRPDPSPRLVRTIRTPQVRLAYDDWVYPSFSCIWSWKPEYNLYPCTLGRVWGLNIADDELFVANESLGSMLYQLDQNGLSGEMADEVCPTPLSFEHCGFIHETGLAFYETYNDPLEVHHFQSHEDAYNDIFFKDNLAYASDDNGGMHIIDYTDRQRPRLLAHFDYWGAYEWATSPGRGVMIEVHDDYAIMASGEAGLFVIDVAEPEMPQLVEAYSKKDKYGSLNLFEVTGEYLVVPYYAINLGPCLIGTDGEADCSNLYGNLVKHGGFEIIRGSGGTP